MAPPPVTSPFSPLSPVGDPWLTWPNLLSLSRIALGAALWSSQALHSVVWLSLLTALAATTDVLDGFIARRQRAGLPLGNPHPIGAWLDPLCDKIFILSLIGVVYVLRRPPPLLIVLLLSREILQAPLMLVYACRWLVSGNRTGGHLNRVDFRANVLGKATTVLQFITLLGLLVGVRWAIWPGVATAVFGVLAVVSYVVRGLWGPCSDRSAPAPPG